MDFSYYLANNALKINLGSRTKSIAVILLTWCPTDRHAKLQGPVVRKLDSAIHQITIFFSAVEMLKKL